LDHEDYIESLSNLDPVTLRQLLAGDWDALPSTGFLQKHWFNIVANGPVGFNLRWIRFWDFANKIKKQNDFTAGALTTTTPNDGHFYIKDIEHGKWEAPDAIEIVYQTACLDPPGTEIFIEDTANGTAIAQTIMRQSRFRRFKIQTVSVSLNKQTRASAWASRARSGFVNLVEGPWIGGFFDECVTFGQKDAKDDRIDAVSGSYAAHDVTTDNRLHRGR
jgi:predicted phage terminase large subunit-like protein